MAYTALVLILVVFIFYNMGYYLLYCVLGLEKSKTQYSIAIIFLAGLAALTTLLLWISIFYRINWEVLVVLTLCSLIISLKYSTTSALISEIKKKNLSEKIFLSFTLFWIIFWVSQGNTYPDTSNYHAQSVKWLENYKTIKGLGNLHGRLAFNYSWHLIIALFSTSFLLGYPSLAVGGFFLFLIILFFVEQLKTSNERLILISFLLLVLIIGKQNFGFSISTSMNPDFIVTGIIWVILTIYFFFEPSWENSIILLLLFFLSATIKVNSIIIFPFVLLSLFRNKQNILDRKNFKIYLFCGLLLIPFIIKNIILSGYILYPFSELNLFNFSWKIPEANVKIESLQISRYAKVNDFILNDAFLLMQPFTWIPIWWTKILTTFSKLTMLSVCFSFLIVIFSWKQIKFKIESCLFFAITIAWFCFSPDIRFGSGFLYFCIFFQLSHILYLYKISFFKNSNPYFIHGILAFFFCLSLYKPIHPLKFAFFTPTPFPSGTGQWVNIDRHKILMPTGSGCEYTYPCSYTVYDGIFKGQTRLLGKNLEDGFWRDLSIRQTR